MLGHMNVKFNFHLATQFSDLAARIILIILTEDDPLKVETCLNDA
jgi:hypothetical protein